MASPMTLFYSEFLVLFSERKMESWMQQSLQFANLGTFSKIDNENEMKMKIEYTDVLYYVNTKCPLCWLCDGQPFFKNNQ